MEELFKLLVVVLTLCTGCMGQFNITVNKVERYALSGWNATFIYTIISTEKGIEPDTIRLKVELSKSMTDVLYKITFKKGKYEKNMTKMMNTSPGKSLARYAKRVSIDYQKPNLVFNLRNITDEDFGRNYEVEVRKKIYHDRFLQSIKLIKAEKPKIYESDFFGDEKKLINRGGNDEYICRAFAVPGAMVRWVLNGEILTKSYEKAKLVIKDAKIDSSGNYECIANNIAGTTKETLALEVAHMDYMNSVREKTISIKLGGTINIDCNIDGHPKPTFIWKDPSGSVIRTERGFYLANVNAEQFGNYTCIAKNQADKMEYVVQVKQSLEAPIISNSSFFPEKTVIRGTNDQFVCHATGVPAPKIWWLEKDKTIKNDTMLTLVDVEKDEGGDYTCIAENVVGVVNRTMYLAVTYIEYPKGKISSSTVNLTEGEDMEVTCYVTGVPTPSYKWLNPLGVAIATTKRLKIANVMSTDKGNYICEGLNSAKLLRYEVLLNVKALPTTPTTTTTTVTTTRTTTTTTTRVPSTAPSIKVVTRRVNETKSTSPKLVVEANASQKSATINTARIHPYIMFLTLYIVYLLLK